MIAPTKEPKHENMTLEPKEKDTPQLATRMVPTLAGYTNLQTLKIEGFLEQQSVIILIDARNTHNFISNKVAAHLMLQKEYYNEFKVKVANDQILKCNQKCPRNRRDGGDKEEKKKRRGREEEEEGKRGEEKGLRPSASAQMRRLRRRERRSRNRGEEEKEKNRGGRRGCSTSVSGRGNRGGAVHRGREGKKRKREDEKRGKREKKEKRGRRLRHVLMHLCFLHGETEEVQCVGEEKGRRGGEEKNKKRKMRKRGKNSKGWLRLWLQQ
ncbi:hypothetical protein BHM03_00028341 [Ensete ventricosum]|nr:hypothetical protein BHM03_00028341 [Ensete ventricosum]